MIKSNKQLLIKKMNVISLKYEYKYQNSNVKTTISKFLRMFRSYIPAKAGVKVTIWRMRCKLTPMN